MEAQFAAEDPASRSARVSWASDAPVPVGLDHLRELSEYWVHRQQILDSLDLNDRTEVLLPVVLDGLRWAYPHGLRHLRADPDDAVEVEVTGPVSCLWRLSFNGSGWRFSDETPGRVIGRVRLTAEQAWRLLTNNLTNSAADEIDLFGEPDVTRALLMTRAVIGHSKWSSWPR